ncbi:MAG: peptidylprolyl isomerase [candidate division KSB1 bacterium]|nr:peptidylprolyl isomerase [candidate division KSB1 bacterium]MDZ7301127.1 peptidylprolyl isomerase [candidate division KSB1 bacterium]MDZ7311989.1 peptidylprolyl isomerase [candidate division KSB1 bacterium]
MITPNQVRNRLSRMRSKGPYRSIPIIIIAIITTIILLKIYTTRDEQNEKLLAVVGNRIIDKEDFFARYRALRSKIDLPDNAQSRSEIFNAMLEEELLIAEAENRGYDKDADGRFQRERIKIQELLDAFHERLVSNGMVVNEDELRQLFIRLNTKIKARHLYALTRRQADSLYAELRNGKSFDELAKATFKDPQLRGTGGSLGYFTVDEMDPFFEEAAFTLNPGEISQPVRTAQGYSIIQVQDRITKPLLTESEYARRRAGLEQYWRHRKMKKATRLFVDSLRRSLDVSFNKPVVVELLQSIKQRSLVPAKVENDYDWRHHEELDHKELVRSKLGVWEVKTFREHAQFTSDGQLRWVRNEENLEDFIAGLVVRAYMLAEAKKLGLHESEAYRAKIKQKMDEYLLKRMEETISSGILIPDDTLRTYFQQHRNQFQIPPKIHLREIVLSDEAKAAAIKKQLLNNASFEQLAKAHSVRRWSAENDGNLGSFTYQELGKYADRIFPLEVGQWVGPIKMDTLYAFFKCAGKDAERARTFDEARSEIEKILKPIWRKKAKQDLLNNIRQQVKVVTYPERLQSIQLN